jgi:hypothetical protein
MGEGPNTSGPPKAERPSTKGCAGVGGVPARSLSAFGSLGWVGEGTAPTTLTDTGGAVCSSTFAELPLPAVEGATACGGLNQLKSAGISAIAANSAHARVQRNVERAILPCGGSILMDRRTPHFPSSRMHEETVPSIRSGIPLRQSAASSSVTTSPVRPRPISSSCLSDFLARRRGRLVNVTCPRFV